MTTQATPTGHQMTGTTDSPNCNCCNPVQPLEPPSGADGLWTCPVTGKKFMYDPAEGASREVNPTVDRQAVDMDLFPKAPCREDVRQVNPQDPFAL